MVGSVTEIRLVMAECEDGSWKVFPPLSPVVSLQEHWPTSPADGTPYGAANTLSIRRGCWGWGGGVSERERRERGVIKG